MTQYPNIPPEISLESISAWVKPRVTDKRFAHIRGVVAVAKKLAKAANCSLFHAELAAWLHDACKEIKDKQLIELAQQYSIPLDDLLLANGHLLHGPVAAQVAWRELKIRDQQVHDAIAEHTLGAAPMCDLSKVLYLADCLEESRPQSYTEPIWQALGLPKNFNMDAAIVAACDQGIQFLISQGKPIHPRVLTVRNYYLPNRKKQSD